MEDKKPRSWVDFLACRKKPVLAGKSGSVVLGRSQTANLHEDVLHAESVKRAAIFLGQGFYLRVLRSLRQRLRECFFEFLTGFLLVPPAGATQVQVVGPVVQKMENTIGVGGMEYFENFERRERAKVEMWAANSHLLAAMRRSGVVFSAENLKRFLRSQQGYSDEERNNFKLQFDLTTNTR